MLIDGLKYSHDTATYDESIKTPLVDVVKGGETETTIVFLVKGHPATAILEYDQLFGPELVRINHYSLSQSGNSDEAIKAYDKAIIINPHDAFSWSLKGDALSEQNNFDMKVKKIYL